MRMSRKLITGLVFLAVTIFVVLIISGSVVKSDSFNVAQAAKASGTDAAAEGREKYEKELQELLTERKRLLSDVVDSMKIFLDSGRMDMDEYVNANIALLRAEMDLSKTQNERLEILEKIIQFHKKYEEHVAKMIANGKSSEIGLNKAKAATLEARIELVREKLKGQSS
jgi:outer membrane protein TolC